GRTVVPMGKGAYPYEVLAKYGVHPGWTAREIDGLVPYGAEVRRAWDALRFPQRRLQVDYLLLRVASTSSLPDLHHELLTAQGPLNADRLRALLEADYPIWLLLEGKRDEACNELRHLLQNRPADARTAHRLALLALADARAKEQQGQHKAAFEDW